MINKILNDIWSFQEVKNLFSQNLISWSILAILQKYYQHSLEKEEIGRI